MISVKKKFAFSSLQLGKYVPFMIIIHWSLICELSQKAKPKYKFNTHTNIPYESAICFESMSVFVNNLGKLVNQYYHDTFVCRWEPKEILNKLKTTMNTLKCAFGELWWRQSETEIRRIQEEKKHVNFMIKIDTYVVDQHRAYVHFLL